MGRFLRNLSLGIILPALLLLPSSPLYAQEPAYQQALRNMSEKFGERFPHIEGFVVSVQGGDLYLGLGERDRVKKGLNLSVLRPGEAFKHPITGEVLGYLEEKIGEAEVIEVREKFSIARMLRLVPGKGYSPRKGDKVRFSSAKVRIAVLPFHNRTDEVINTDLLTRTLVEYLKATGRFEVFDLDRLQVWFLETGIPLDKILEGDNARQLQRLIIRDLVLQTSIRSLKEHMVLEGRLFSLGTGNILEEAEAVLAELPSAVVATQTPVPLAREGKGQAPRPQGPSLGSQFLLSREGAPSAKGSLQQFILDGMEVRGAALGDVDGDGKNELVVAGQNLIKVFRVVEGRLDALYTYKAGGFDKCLWIDVADVNGNGREEIYVTSVRDTGLLSYVLELEGGELRLLTSSQNYYFRAFKAQEGKPLLVAQRQGITTPFYGKVVKLGWKSRGLRSLGSLGLPKDFDIMAFTIWDLDGDGREEYIQVGADDKLRVYNSRGRVLWTSSQRYGGFPVSFDFEAQHEVAFRDRDSLGTLKVEIPVRGKVLVYDVDGDGVKELLTLENLPAVSRAVRGLGYEGNHIVSLVWDGSGLAEVWRTRQQAGYGTDFFVGDVDNDGREELVLVTVKQEILGSRRSRIIIFKIRG